MNQHEWESFLQETQDKERATHQSKQGEYANQDNVFLNFEEGARIEGHTPEEEAWAYMRKHITSMRKMLRGEIPLTKELIDEKMGDATLYSKLIWGMLRDRIK